MKGNGEKLKAEKSYKGELDEKTREMTEREERKLRARSGRWKGERK